MNNIIKFPYSNELKECTQEEWYKSEKYGEIVVEDFMKWSMRNRMDESLGVKTFINVAISFLAMQMIPNGNNEKMKEDVKNYFNYMVDILDRVVEDSNEDS